MCQTNQAYMDGNIPNFDIIKKQAVINLQYGGILMCVSLNSNSCQISSFSNHHKKRNAHWVSIFKHKVINLLRRCKDNAF